MHHQKRSKNHCSCNRCQPCEPTPCCNPCDRQPSACACCNPCNSSACRCCSPCPPPPCPVPPNPCCNPQIRCCTPLPCGYNKNICLFPFLERKGCYIQATLEVTVDTNSYLTVGQIITFTYKLTNTGNICLNFPVLIIDNIFGCFTVCPSLCPCGGTETFIKTYTVTIADISRKSISSKATAYIQSFPKKWVCTNTVVNELTYGSSFVSFTIAQVAQQDQSILVTINITNAPLPTSSTEARNVTVYLPFPSGITTVSNLSGTFPALAPVISGAGVFIQENSIPVGSTYVYSYTYTPITPGTYIVSGTLGTATLNTNLNRTVSNSITF